ncbi:hypothetical protein BABINDRAFT_154796 [Babjeviella inositovora NRRL Y-12698]|uniref:Uncharacterized protein n=1 Tax=Babjeviella inositovora NRRL Y-12698 TaxID=984486 RepID=A0A1E3QMM4_9ASCO|nr:uncharacterized protein BABINDRAFT_154796 [Babjeviella inositovora NRRL Y-12698]ODQ78890.1 hypothetical protein BABINDRAFT_154796 [Babjeviella inositovora NRRL Y-12698]
MGSFQRGSVPPVVCFRVLQPYIPQPSREKILQDAMQHMNLQRVQHSATHGYLYRGLNTYKYMVFSQ